MTYKKRDIAQAIVDVNVRGNTLLRKKGLDTPLYTTTYDVCDKIKSLTPKFNIDFTLYESTADKNSIWVYRYTEPDEITVNSNNLPYTENMGEIDMTDIIGDPIFYNNYLCWFTQYKLNRYNLHTKVVESYDNALIYHYSKIFCYDKYIAVINSLSNSNAKFFSIYNIDDLSRIDQNMDVIKEDLHRLIGNKLYIQSKVGEKPNSQFPNNPNKNIDIIGYNTYNFDTGVVEINVKSPQDLPEDIVEYKGNFYHASFTNPEGNSGDYLYLYEYNNYFEKKPVRSQVGHRGYTNKVIYQTIIGNNMYVVTTVELNNNTIIKFLHMYRFNLLTNYAANKVAITMSDEIINYKDLQFIDYYNTIFILGGSLKDNTHKHIFKICLDDNNKSHLVEDAFKELPDTYTSSFTHLYNNKIYILHQDSVITLMSYDIGLLRSGGYLSITTGNGDEKYPLINHKNFKLDVNISDITYYHYNFNETKPETRIYKDGVWKLINT